MQACSENQKFLIVQNNQEIITDTTHITNNNMMNSIHLYQLRKYHNNPWQSVLHYYTEYGAYNKEDQGAN